MFFVPGWSLWTLGPILSAWFLVIVWTVYRCCFAPWRVLKRHGIKGPSPLPILGNYKDFSSMGGISESLKFYDFLTKKYGPISGFYVGKRMRVLVADEDVMKEILTKDFESFPDRPHVPSFTPKPYGPNTLFRANGEIWKRDRRMIAPLLHQRKMIIPLVKPSVEMLTRLIEEKANTGETFDVYKLFGNYTMESIFAVYLGHKKDLQKGETDEYYEAAFGTFNSPMRRGNILLGLMLYTNFPFIEKIMTFLRKNSQSSKNYKVLYESTLKTVQARREQGSSHQDLLQLLIDAKGNETGQTDCPLHEASSKPSGAVGLSDERVAQLAVGNVLGGYENVAVALGYLSYLLAINPEIQEKLQKEIDEYFQLKPEADLPDAAEDIAYLDNVVQEALRMYPPAPRVSHECVKTTTINGITFPKGCNTIIPIYLFGHDPKVWDDPEKFNPDRFEGSAKAQLHPLSHIPFGFGPRYCIGIEYCYLAIKMAIVSLLRKCSFARAPDTEVPLQVVLETVLTPKNGIYLKVNKKY